MTDSSLGARRPAAGERAPGRAAARMGKRERLTAAAVRMLHEQGVEKTTIADIARAAEVPVGNVYYYFKTKDDLVEAAVAAHARGLEELTAALEERHPAPQDRLKALVAAWAEQRDLAARFGCPFGTLCSELDKRADGLDRAAAEVLRLLIDWAQRQFRAMGRGDSRDLAVALVAAYQGASLITNTLRDPELMTRECARLASWIDSLT